MILKTKQGLDDRAESVTRLGDMGAPRVGSAFEAAGVEGSHGGSSAAVVVQADTFGADRSVRRPILVSAADRNPVWITMACGQRFCTDQIGSMFGRE
jgi:hypothetical protein